MYAYTPPYDPVSSEGFYKYDTTADTWAAGACLALTTSPLSPLIDTVS